MDKLAVERSRFSHDSLSPKGLTGTAPSRLAIDQAIYNGTTQTGGANNYGVVFGLSPSGSGWIIYNFHNEGDGGFPLAGLVMDSAGNLYGTSSVGGMNLGGVVFAPPSGLKLCSTVSVQFPLCVGVNSNTAPEL